MRMTALTAMEASRKAPRVANQQEKKGDIALDAEFWGELQNHVPLHCVYEKLSPDDLFRLRRVCKAWNHKASQRLLPKPSFVLISAGDGPCEPWSLNGILTYDVVSGRFDFKPHHFPLIQVDDSRRFQDNGVPHHVQAFETEGLVLCHNPHDCAQRGVFNVHNQTWHVIPPPPPPRCESLSICGLMVDISLKPYTFKLIEGNLDFSTRIYDSKTRSWSTTRSRLLQTARRADFASFQYTCICNNGHVYISLGSVYSGRFMILRYSMEDDLWTTLKFPMLSCESEDGFQSDNSLGVWEGRIFTTRENSEKQRLTVWELVDSQKQIWEEYAHTSKMEYASQWRCEMCLRSFFRDGYLLVVMWQLGSGHANALILFNMATKKWQKASLPMGTVAMEEQKFGLKATMMVEKMLNLNTMLMILMILKIQKILKIGDCQDSANDLELPEGLGRLKLFCVLQDVCGILGTGF